MLPRCENIKGLVKIAGPLWAGEREILSTYFGAENRTRETDLVWLKRQCFKEIWGSGIGDKKRGLFQGPVAYLHDIFPKIDRGEDRHSVLAVIDDLRSEFYHYCLFADIHDFISGGRLEPGHLAGWSADDRLAELRYHYKQNQAELGHFASRFTEGGYCSLFVVGMELSGTGEVNDRIANACKQVYNDEIGHMQQGFRGLARQDLDSSEWAEVASMVEAILVQRLYMRNEQFSYPLSRQRIEEIIAGHIDPVGFDYSNLED